MALPTGSATLVRASGNARRLPAPHICFKAPARLAPCAPRSPVSSPTCKTCARRSDLIGRHTTRVCLIIASCTSHHTLTRRDQGQMRARCCCMRSLARASIVPADMRAPSASVRRHILLFPTVHRAQSSTIFGMAIMNLVLVGMALMNLLVTCRFSTRS